MLEILHKKHLPINQFSRPGIKLKEVRSLVVHWIANPNQDADALYTFFKWLANGQGGYASTQYCISLKGDKIYELMPPDEVAWQGGTPTPQAAKLYPGNPSWWLLGAEWSHYDWSGKPSEGQWNTAVLFYALLWAQHKATLIKGKELIRHYDITGKPCHKWFVDNESEWNRFRTEVMIKIREMYGPSFLK